MQKKINLPLNQITTIFFDVDGVFTDWQFVFFLLITLNSYFFALISALSGLHPNSLNSIPFPLFFL